MTSLEEQLVEAGNKLLHPPSSVDDLLILLEQVENILSSVEQSPSESMRNALSLSVKALVANNFLRHPDVDMKVAVAACFSEITRITAPDVPYDDNQMRVVLQLIVSSFENLSDKSSKSYDKRISILETLAKVRTGMVMLDLECDGLIAEMFQNFLKAIRDYHPDNVFSSMETIMTLVLEESDDISFELILSMLAIVKRDNQEVLPITCKLVENVFENCARKVEPYLKHAMKSSVFSLNDYSNLVASICSGRTGAVEHNDDNASRELMDQANRESVIDAHPRDDSVDGYPKVLSNSIAGTGHEDGIADPESSKKPDYAHQADQSFCTNVTSTSGPDDSNNGKIIKSESKSRNISKKRGRKSKSPINSTEPADSSRVDKEAERIGGRGKILSKEVGTSHSTEPTAKVAVPSQIEKETIQLSSPNVTSSSPSGSVPDDAHPKKAGRPNKKDNLIQEGATSSDVSKKASAGTSGTKVKPQRCSGRRAPAGNVLEETTIVLGATKGGGVTASDSQEKPLEQSGSITDVRDSIGDGSLSKKKEEEKRHGRGKSTSEKDATKSSIKDDAKETVSSPKRTSKLLKDEDLLQGTAKSPSKRKRKPGTEKASDAIEYGDNLVGAKVKVWWPYYDMFYEGVINSFDHVKKKHQVSYADGDEENLNLKNERWEFVEGDSMPDQEQVTKCPSPDLSPETQRKKKAKTNSESASQQGKMKGSRKLKGRATKSGRKSRDQNKVDGKSKDSTSKSGANSEVDSGDKPKDSSKKNGTKSGNSSRTLVKSKDCGTPKTRSKSKQDTPETATKSKGTASRIGNKSNACGSGKVTSGKVKETKGKEMSPEVVKSEDVGGTSKIRSKSKRDTPKTPTKSKIKASKSGNKSNAYGSGKVTSGKVKETKGKEKSPEVVKSEDVCGMRKTRSKSKQDVVKTPEHMKGQETCGRSGKKRRRGVRS
ncbi:Sister chromatid cohesion protein PDS5 B-B like [Actinidia chinensis var. chinensis]|uniref:Sister chromatid cohesion protein PDS5 B-B like n=1 Tax=Actinidia chinensis var. chinensis TaxID=1590841 RepID=A0A2R6QZD1_ACTCC|nr:Sister chromatid cohesion protein PDS5 B-B like [Actinidia chinensis var. chinensis]